MNHLGLITSGKNKHAKLVNKFAPPTNKPKVTLGVEIDFTSL